MRAPVPHRSPPRKDFCRAKMPCGGRDCQICCSAGKSSDFLQTSGYLHARKRVLPKYVEDCPIGKAMQIWNSRDLKRAAALLFPKESRGNPFKGSLWATSSPRLDTALLCAAKKRGVELNQLAGFCQFKLALAATAGSNDYSSSCSGSTLSIEITRLPSSTRIKITPCVSRL